MTKYQKKARPVKIYRLYSDFSGGEVPKWVAKELLLGNLVNKDRNCFLVNDKVHNYGDVLINDGLNIYAVTSFEFSNRFERVKENE